MEVKKELKNLLYGWIAEQSSPQNGFWGRTLGFMKPCVFDSIFDSIKREEWDRVIKPLWEKYWSKFYHDIIDAGIGDGKCSVDVIARKRLELRDSIWDAIASYIGSLVKPRKWEYVKNNGEYPFKSGLNLWLLGYIASFDGKVWRLHLRETGEIIYEV